MSADACTVLNKPATAAKALQFAAPRWHRRTGRLFKTRATRADTLNAWLRARGTSASTAQSCGNGRARFPGFLHVPVLRWLEPFQRCFGRRAQRLALRAYVHGVFSDSDRKSMQAMLARVTQPVT